MSMERCTNCRKLFKLAPGQSTYLAKCDPCVQAERRANEEVERYQNDVPPAPLPDSSIFDIPNIFEAPSYDPPSSSPDPSPGFGDGGGFSGGGSSDVI